MGRSLDQSNVQLQSFHESQIEAESASKAREEEYTDLSNLINKNELV
jgi:hypothetical protein